MSGLIFIRAVKESGSRIIYKIIIKHKNINNENSHERKFSQDQDNKTGVGIF